MLILLRNVFSASGYSRNRLCDIAYKGKRGVKLALTFIVVLPYTNQHFALAIAEKLRILIFDEIFEKEQPLNVTASFGVGERIGDEDFATAFKRVDDALYKAKNQGRNCCVMTGNT